MYNLQITALSRNLVSDDLSPKKKEKMNPLQKNHQVLPTSSSLRFVRWFLNKQSVTHLCCCFFMRSQKKAKGGVGKGRRTARHQRGNSHSRSSEPRLPPRGLGPGAAPALFFLKAAIKRFLIPSRMRKCNPYLVFVRHDD